MTEQELKDEREQAVKRGGEIYADHYMEGLLDGLKLALRQPYVIGQVCGHRSIMHINSEIGWLCFDCRKFSKDKQTFL